MSDWPTPEAVSFIDPSALPPGAVVILELPDGVSAETARRMQDAWNASVGVPCVMLAAGVRVAKVTTEIPDGAR